jgi:hemoglobin/transferrin/lactoferrin receptor protein
MRRIHCLALTPGVRTLGVATETVAPRPTAVPLCALALALAGVCAPSARAQSTPTIAAVLPEVTVSAERERRSVDQTTATVTVIPAEEIEQRFVKDIRDLVRHEPGVAVRRAPSRFGAALGSTGRDGNAGFNIRGLEGNRVLIQVDGIRVPQAFSFGASSFGRGGYTDLSTLRSVEILRGPASALYGSDGLAGVVSFFTVDPADLLGDAQVHGSVAAAYAGEDDSVTWSLRTAARVAGDAARGSEVMAVVTRRDGDALENFGSNTAADATRTAPNPQALSNTSLLAKWVQRMSADAGWRVTLERVDATQSADVLSARSAPPLGATSVLRLDARDETDRSRASVDGVIESLGWFAADRLQWAVYTQDAQSTQRSVEDRNVAADRVRDNRYAERVAGLNLQAYRQIRTAALAHRIVYGVDLARAEITNLRTGTVPPPGESFPTKAFADSDVDSLGVFVQDEISLGDAWFITPGLRYDRFAIDPRVDPLFPGTPASLSDSRITPRLALRWRHSAAMSLYAQWTAGFRAPTPDQVNNGFTNLFSPGAAYVSVGNPDLKPETSRSVELGVRGQAGPWRYAAAVFNGRYENFIEQIVVGGSGTVADPQRFQFVNLGEVRIRGVEARVAYRVSPVWQLQGSYAQARGTDRTRGLPLNSVQPPKASVEAQWQPGRDLSVAAIVNRVWAKERDRISSSGLAGGQQQFATPLFTTVDLVASWRFGRRVDLGAGVFNLTERKVWHWSDVQGVAQNSPVLDAFTQPGRSLAVRVRLTY